MGKLKRKDSFFGLHFDFHADKITNNIGEKTTEQMVQDIIDIANPDFLQCDCKGHIGLSSYPTKVGNPAPGIKKDALRIWREVTEKNDTALYIHYSGVFDEEAIMKHPEWAVINFDGTKNNRATSVFGKYVDELLIPQLFELADEYKLDGAWIDGECWGTIQDYGENVIDEFKKNTGITEIPKNKGDKYFIEFTEFCRSGFKKYLNHYINAVHSKYPDFQMTSNWAFTTYMPEKVSADLDYLSGDVWGVDCVNVARFEARYMSQQNMPWDLMSWNMSVAPKSSTDATGESDHTADKPAIQLMQEAAVVLAQGGGFQIYYIQDKDGTVDTEKVLTAADVAKFCRARQPYCFKSKSVAEIAILNSSYAGNRLNAGPYGFWNGDLDWIKGVMQCMINAQLPVDVVSEFHLDENIDRYSVIVIPEWDELNNIPQLLDYVRNGGNLIVIGSECTKLFEKQLGVEIIDTLQNKNVFLAVNHLITSFGKETKVTRVIPTDAQVIDKLYYEHKRTADQDIAATVNNYGKGKIAGIYFDFGRQYLYGRTFSVSDFLKNIVDILIPKPKVSVTGSRYIEVTLSELNKKTTIGLINTSGAHSNPYIYTFDEILPVGPIKVMIKCEYRPNRIFLQPQNQQLDFEYSNNITTVIVDKVGIYDILVID